MRITAEEGKKLLEELGDKVTLIDIRHSFEYEAGHIPGAILIDNDEMSAQAMHPMLPKDLKRPLIIYCRSGVRTRAAFQKLKALGYETVYDMGGIIHWPYEIER